MASLVVPVPLRCLNTPGHNQGKLRPPLKIKTLTWQLQGGDSFSCCVAQECGERRTATLESIALARTLLSESVWSACALLRWCSVVDEGFVLFLLLALLCSPHPSLTEASYAAVCTCCRRSLALPGEVGQLL